MNLARWARPMQALLATLIVAGSISGCGGGGGGGGGPALGVQEGTFTAVFDKSPLQAQGVEGKPETVQVTATLGFTGDAGGGLYLVAETDTDLVLDISGDVSGDRFDLTITLRGDLAVGEYNSELRLRACLDQACTREAKGSPVVVPVRYQVKGNLQVQTQLVLGRTGNEAAPEARLPVTIPPGVTDVVLIASNPRPDAIELSFDGQGLRVTTRQVRAGSYTASATLQSASDARVARTVEIQYTVAPPAGGERELSVADPFRTVALEQGARSAQRLLVTRPTWTNVWDPPQIGGPLGQVAALVALGDGNYEVTINSAGAVPGDYSGYIAFSAGPTSGLAIVSFSVTINVAFYVDGELYRSVTASSTAADLNWTNPVRTVNGQAARWTAVSRTASIRVVNRTGITDVDPLLLVVDASVLTRPEQVSFFEIEVSIDRAGALPQVVQMSLSNQIATLDAVSPATLVGSTGRVYVGGAQPTLSYVAYTEGRLTVEGATVTAAHRFADTRFFGDVSKFALDLTGATPGTPIRIRVNSALLPTQVQLQVQAPLRATAATQALPFAPHRPGQYVPTQSAFYFAAPGTAYRWAFAGGTWALTQRSLPGLIDVAPAPEENALYAATPTSLVELDPSTLAQRAVGALSPGLLFPRPFELDPDALPGARALAFSADGRAVASTRDPTFPGSHPVAWICTQELARAVPPLIESPRLCDPGTLGQVGGETGSGIVRSVNGGTLVGINPNGARSLHRPENGSWTSAASLPAGNVIVAASDSGTRFVRNDGMLLDNNDAQFGNLASLLPFSHVAGGFGLSSGGRFGLIYGYRLEGSGSAQRAVDATLWVVDLNNASSAGVLGSPVLATVPMPAAVGCTAPLVAGETCRHNGLISVAPGDATAFVVGPRGVAALPLPSAVNGALPQSGARGRNPLPTR